jgi:hypothetical protein
MLITPTSYPGGPEGLAARLERRDRWPIVRRLARVHWPVGAACLLLGALFLILYNGPGAYGVLMLVCFALALLFFTNPFVMASNMLMDVFYFDQQWAAVYRPYRRSSVDLTQVTAVIASGGLWDFQRRGRLGITVPEPLLLLDPVRTIVSRALTEAARTRTVKMSDQARQLIADTVPDDTGNVGLFSVPIAKPPYRAWDGVRRRRRWNQARSNI